MTGVPRPACLAAVAALSALVTVLALASLSHLAQASHAGGMDAMSIDMDPTGNTATSLGTRQSCGEALPGGTLTFDITAQGIPPYNNNGTPTTLDDTGGMRAYSTQLVYDEARLTVESENQAFLLAASPGSQLFPGSQFLPDQDNNNAWISTALDTSAIPPDVPESGSGVLTRVSISVSLGAPSGFYSLHLSFGIHINVQDAAAEADSLFSGLLAVGALCQNAPSVTPTPVPIPTYVPPPPTPPPNPTPTPGLGVGPMNRMSMDMKTSGNSATALGALNQCVEASPGDLVQIDITADGIPAYSQNGTPGNLSDDYGGITGYFATLVYSESALTIETEDQQFLLTAAAGSNLAPGSQTSPDTDSGGDWLSAAVDGTSRQFTTPESGDGVLTRLTIGVDLGASPGVQALVLQPGNSGHLDAFPASFKANSLANGFIAVGVPCDVDNDSVADEQDACPDLPGPASNDGCPPSGPLVVGGIAGLDDNEPAPRATDGESAGAAAWPLLVVAAVGALLTGVAAAWWARQQDRRSD